MPATDDSPDAAHQPLRVPLRRPPLWYPGLSLLLVVALFFGLSAVWDAAPRLWSGSSLPVDTLLSLLAAAGWLLLLSLVWLKRYLTRRWAPAPIVFDADAVRLPRSPELWRYRNVAYSDIVAVHEGGRPHQRQFLIESRHHTYYLPQSLFAEVGGPETLLLGLRRRILALPQGTRLIEETERTRNQARMVMTDRPLATQGVLGLGAIFFVNAWLKGGLDAPFGLLRWGADAPALVFAGEYDRLLTANFLHSHWAHALVNGVALFYLGGLLERVLGWARFVLIYGMSGAVAMVASAYLSGAVMSVGASGAIFGLLAGFGVFSWRLRTQLPLEFRQTPRWWVAILATNALVPLYFPSIDIVAHIAGFAAGGALTFVLLWNRRYVPPRASLPLSTLAGLTIALYVGALGTAVWRAATSGPEAEMAFAQTLLAEPRTKAHTLNAIAWLWVVDPRSNSAQLGVAERCAEAAIARSPQEAGLYATLAMVHDRRHATAAAVQTWATALQRAEAADMQADGGSSKATSADDGVAPRGNTASAFEARLDASLYAAHLAQAMLARATDAPPLEQPLSGPVPKDLTLTSGVWTLQAAAPLAADTLVYALLYVEHTPVALVQVAVAANSPPPWRAPRTMTEEMGGAARGHLVLMGRRADYLPPLPAGQASTWTAWPLPELLQRTAP
jgi:membrane associated rhomboid family serine protease